MVRKKTHEEFLDEVKALVGEEYIVLGKYVNSKKKIAVKHNECGYEYDVQAGSFLSGARCPKCSGKMKKNTEIFKQEVHELVGDEYEVIGKYVKSSEKIEMKHTKCGHKYDVVPSGFLNGRRCSKCSNIEKVKKRRMTNTQFDKRLYDIAKESIIRIDNYVNSQKKIMFFHNVEECGHRWKATPNSILQGTGCPKCAGKTKKTTEMFKEEVFNLVGNQYTVTGEYVNTKTKIKIKHGVCNREWSVVPSSFLRGVRCPECQHGSYKKTTEIFKKEVLDLVGDEYEVLGEYIDNKTKIKFKHKKCASIWETTPSSILSGRRCLKCANSIRSSESRKTQLQFEKEVLDLTKGEFLVVGQYKNTNTKIDIKHLVCESTFAMRPYSFLAGNRCPVCKESKGEKNIRKYLLENECLFLSQYRFADCKDKYPLPFDFAITDNNRKVQCIIEYDGRQHYQSIKHFGGEDGLKQTQKRDQIKNQYCKDNNIKLIRIPYWDFDNIEDILNEELKDLIGSKICTQQAS